MSNLRVLNIKKNFLGRQSH